MIAVVAAVLAGALVSAMLWFLGSGTVEVHQLLRTNYRGATVATGVGVLIPLSVVLVVAAVEVVLLGTGHDPRWIALGQTTLTAVATFGLLGLLDDIVGQGQSGGFRQHLGAMAQGRLTSGALKILVGGAAGVLVATRAPGAEPGVLGALRDGASVALAANLANLLDRAPGRCIKFSGVTFAGAVLVSRRAELAGPAVGLGAAMALLLPDLRERIMLGDAGANPLGALVGLAWLVALPSAGSRWLLLGIVLAANVASEAISFSTVIDSVAPLRWFDRLGSLRSGNRRG